MRTGGVSIGVSFLGVVGSVGRSGAGAFAASGALAGKGAIGGIRTPGPGQSAMVWFVRGPSAALAADRIHAQLGKLGISLSQTPVAIASRLTRAALTAGQGRITDRALAKTARSNLVLPVVLQS